MNTTEKKVSHTPGPWRASGTYALVTTDKLKICEVHINENVSDDDFSYEQWKANAKLIAAAPELLEALIGWVNLNVRGLNGIAIIDAKNKTERAAIEKAINAIQKATE